MLVASSENENPLSRRIDHLLYRNYGKKAAAMLTLPHEQFMDYFKAAFESGDYLDALWISAVHPLLPIELKRDIFGDIHMAMHWSSAQSIKLKQKAAAQKKELLDLRQSIKDTAQHRRTLQKRKEILERSQRDLRAALACAEKENIGLKAEIAKSHDPSGGAALERENRLLKDRLVILEDNLKKMQSKTAFLEEKNRRLSSRLSQQLDINEHFKMEIKAVIGQMAALNRCDTDCPSFDLCRKCVLIVGGITRMESLYRELIESSGGIFEYHDGYMKKGAKTLECRLKRADMVLCPISCISHAACLVVKNLGKKHNKPVYMLPNSSLSTVSKVIWGDDRSAAACN
jgi:hypothetical protein